MRSYLGDLENCELCEWRCGVNRLEGERGICMVGKPEIASTTLHPAPPQSYTVFMAGCNLRCLNCQNWTIAHYPMQESTIRGEVGPEILAEEAVKRLNSRRAGLIGADRVFFSGGAPTPSLPYIEKVVEEARKIDESVKVNYDTNGFLTESSLERVIELSDSITFDIKAFEEGTHKELTGAPIEPVLRNVRILAQKASEKILEFRYLLVPGVNDDEISGLATFLSKIDEELPLNFLAFRPNFVLEDLGGVKRQKLEEAVETANESGLKNVDWSGMPEISGRMKKDVRSIRKGVGCCEIKRECGTCQSKLNCPVKSYVPNRRT